MPIFEFRCTRCGEIFERLFLNDNDIVDLKCPRCNCSEIDRVISKTNYMLGLPKEKNRPRLTERSCAPGSKCMTLELPGYSKD